MFSARKGNLFSLFFVLHFILASFIVALIAKYILHVSEEVHQIALSQILLVLFPIFYYFIITKTPIQDTLRSYRTNLLNFLLAALLAVFIMPSVMLINLISQFFVKQALTETLANISDYNYFYVILVIAVFPALFEEMIARGIILSHFRHRNYLIASVMSGFFFGMMHLNINQFLYAFVLGFLFAIVVHLTGSIFCSMLMHFIINGVNVTLAYIASSDIFKAFSEAQNVASLDLTQSEMLVQALPIVLFLVVFSLPVVFLILYGMVALNDKSKLVFKKSPSYAFFIPTKNYESIVAKQGETKELNASIIEELSENAFIPKPKKEPVLTIPFFLTILVFIVVSILNEIS